MVTVAAGDFDCIGSVDLYYTGTACGNSGSCTIVFDFILERLFRRYMSPEDLEREEENDMYAS